MGLANKASKPVTSVEVVEKNIQLQMTPQEYEFLFNLIKNSTFKGEDLELVYNVTLKLQQQYFQVKK